MMGAKPTPGPWQARDPEGIVADERGYIAIIGGQDNRHVCDIFPHGRRINMPKPAPQEILANARLIAAAPDLLEAASAHLAARDALEGANVNSLTPDDPRFRAVADTVELLRAAIAKAGAA